MLRKIALNYHASFSGLSRETWLLSAVILVNRSGTMAVPFMSMYITQHMHRPIGDAGLIISLFGVGAMAGSFASGYFIDKIGFRPVQIFSSAIGGILFILFGLINDFTSLCFLTLALSFVADAFRPANLSAVASYSNPKNLTRSYSLNRLAMNIGWGLGSSLGGILAAINYSLLFWVEGVVYIIVSALIIFLLPKEKSLTAKQRLLGEDQGSVHSPWKDRYFLKFLSLIIVFISCFSLLFRLVPVYWKTAWHIGESMIGIILGLNGIIIAIFEMVLVRHWETRRTQMFYVIAGILVTALGYSFLILPVLPFLWRAFLTVILITIGEMLAFPFVNSIFMSRATEHNRGKYSAAYSFAFAVSMVIGPGGGAIIIGHGGYTALWIVLIVVCLLCGFGLKKLSEP